MQYYDTRDLYSNNYIIVKSCYPYHNLVFPNFHIRTLSYEHDFILAGKYIALSRLKVQSGAFLRWYDDVSCTYNIIMF